MTDQELNEALGTHEPDWNWKIEALQSRKRIQELEKENTELWSRMGAAEISSDEINADISAEEYGKTLLCAIADSLGKTYEEVCLDYEIAQASSRIQEFWRTSIRLRAQTGNLSVETRLAEAKKVTGITFSPEGLIRAAEVQIESLQRNSAKIVKNLRAVSRQNQKLEKENAELKARHSMVKSSEGCVQ